MTTKKKTVFLIEDDVAITDIYKIVMERAGFSVKSITSGHEAFKKITTIQSGEEPAPSIFLLDLILPDMNGIEILIQLKKHPATQNIPVFILTNQEESALEAIGGIRPDKFIIKANISPTQLLDIIKSQFGQ